MFHYEFFVMCLIFFEVWKVVRYGDVDVAATGVNETRFTRVWDHVSGVGNICKIDYVWRLFDAIFFMLRIGREWYKRGGWGKRKYIVRRRYVFPMGRVFFFFHFSRLFGQISLIASLLCGNFFCVSFSVIALLVYIWIWKRSARARLKIRKFRGYIEKYIDRINSHQ